MFDVVLIGAGGTGSHLAEPLYRLLAYHPAANGCQMTVVDGDVYELKNQERQLFHSKYIGKGKAEALTERLKDGLQTEAITLRAINRYLRDDRETVQFFRGLRNPLIITAVDNHATRRLALDELRSCLSYTVINPGNSLDKGVVSVERRVDGALTTSSIRDRYTDIDKPVDVIPGGCAQQAPSSPQLISANAFAATITLTLIQNLLDGNPLPEETYFDCSTLKVKAVGKWA